MNNKYNMTIEDNIFLAKRNIIDIIWKSARLEGLNVTFPDTEAVYNGLIVSNMKVDEVIAINNLKHAWQFVLDTIYYPIDYPYICKINQYVGNNLIDNAGFTRNYPVSIGGTTWKPDMPIESVIKEELSEILAIENSTDKSITLMLYLMRKQAFCEGNKRTSMIAANQVMISNGAGIISVPIEQQREFSKLLVNFYETNDISTIKDFIYNSCIDGISVTVNKENYCNPNNDYYIKVTDKEANCLKSKGVHFDGKIIPDSINVIRINVKYKEMTEQILNSFRNKNHL